VPYLSTSEVMIHEEALYQVYILYYLYQFKRAISVVTYYN